VEVRRVQQLGRDRIVELDHDVRIEDEVRTIAFQGHMVDAGAAVDMLPSTVRVSSAPSCAATRKLLKPLTVPSAVVMS
jgi:hypothetical protein